MTQPRARIAVTARPWHAWLPIILCQDAEAAASRSTALRMTDMVTPAWRLAPKKTQATSNTSASHAPSAPSTTPRTRVSQEDVPACSLDQALRVPRAIAESYAYRPTRPLKVAEAMKLQPSSSRFRMIAGAAIAYGLTTGGAFSSEIAITPLAMKILRPTSDGEDTAAKREALLRPKVVGEFLRGYDGACLPSETIAKNVLEEAGVPVERLDAVLELMLEGAASLGLIREIGGKRYVDIAGTSAPPVISETRDKLHDDPIQIPQQRRVLTSRPAPATVSVASGIHVNIEIHIAADAPADTIENIFKNMRRYVLTSEMQAEGGTARAN